MYVSGQLQAPAVLPQGKRFLYAGLTQNGFGCFEENNLLAPVEIYSTIS
jgi:hypothetical protein